MTKEVVICDICGKPIKDKFIFPHNHRRFKVQMKEFHYYPGISRKWYKIDVHDECFRELGRQIASVKEQRDKDFNELLKNMNEFAKLANETLY